MYNDTLYVSGGEFLAYHRRSMECFDFKASAWRKFDTLMLKPKMNHILFPYNDQLWFFGGQKYHDNRTVEDLSWYSFNVKENAWSDVSFMYSHNGLYRTVKIMDVVVEI